MQQEVAQFLNFAAHSPTVFQATEQACRMLEEAGFSRLAEHEAWSIVPGGRYYVTRNRSALIAFSVPEKGAAHCQIVASHGDSPTFKLKPKAESESAGAYVRLNVERYGGMILTTWLDKPLSIAGRALVRENGKLVTKLIDLNRDALLIPTMPIHFNRDINNGYAYNPQVDMLPVFGDLSAKGALASEVAAKAGVKAEDIVACDLFLYNRTPASVWGAHEEFFSCPRIDDLECAYTSLAAFIAAPAQAHINVCAIFDNEEVGSGTKQGAASPILRTILERVAFNQGYKIEELYRAIHNSFMISADMAHALHPNYPEKHDPTNHPIMNQGPVIKINANQKYITDGDSAAVFATICKMAGVPYQTFVNHSDMAGGSTLGNILLTQMEMRGVDIGNPMWAMHSVRETAGVLDQDYVIKAFTTFYNI